MNSPLRIGVQPDWKREAAECSLYGFERRNSCKLPGFAIDVLDFIVKYSKIPYTIVPVPKGVGAGKLVDRENMTWDGVLGDIQNGRYDTVAAPFMLSSDRSVSFDFAAPFSSTQFMFVIGPSPPNFLEKALRIFTVFEPTLTALVIGTLLILLCGTNIYQALSARQDNIEIFRSKNITNINKVMLSRKLKSKKERNQQSVAQNTLLLLLGYALLFFTGLYESYLLTFLLVPSPEVHMTESQVLELVRQKQLTFIISEDEYNNYGHWQTIRFSKEKKYQIFQAVLKENPPQLYDGDIDQVIKLFHENPHSYVFVARSHDATIFMKEGCNLQQIRMENREVYPAGFVFRKNSTAIINKFNEAIYKNFAFTQSVVEEYRNLDKNTCIRDTSASANIQPLGLLTLFGSFILLFLGFISSFCYLLFESFCYYNNRRTKLNSRFDNFKQVLKEAKAVSKHGRKDIGGYKHDEQLTVVERLTCC